MSSSEPLPRPIRPGSKVIDFLHHRPTPPPLPADLNRPEIPSVMTSENLVDRSEAVPPLPVHPPPLTKALTDVDNFISLDPKYLNRRTDSLESLESPESSHGENVSIPKELPISEDMRRRQKEWADRGAAMIVKDVKDESTGEVTKQVIKKGINDFKFGETLGDGSYSTVLLATSIDSGKKYAVKVLNKEYLIKQKKVKYVNIEKNTLQRLKNTQGIISLYFTFQDESSLYFLLEYAPNGDLLSLMRKFGSVSEECTQYYSAQIIDALDSMYSKGVIHRDLKPENILLDKDRKVKITDFGTAKLLDKVSQEDDGPEYDLLTRSSSFVGTAEYVSPELLNDNWVDYRCDIWAFGCILYQMIAGKPPFKAKNEYLTFQKVMKVQFSFTAGFPSMVRDLVKNILVKNPDRRLSVSMIKSHQFYEGINFDDGSVWSNDPPELAPYKISAKSLQRVPKVSSSPAIVSSQEQIGRTTPSPGSSRKGSNISLPRAISETSTAPKKREVDPRTQRILHNVKKEISQRNLKRAAMKPSQSYASSVDKGDSSPNPATAAAAALSHGKQPTMNTATVHNNGVKSSPSSAGSVKTKRKSGVFIRTSSSHSTSTKSPQSSPSSPYNSGRTNSDLLPMSKVDIFWSFYLKNIQERVIKMGEVKICFLKSQVLDMKVQKSKALLIAADGKTPKRNTLLTQVARGGGNVTGFRQESAELPESEFYQEYLIDFSNIDGNFKKHGTTEDATEEGISKLKHFFMKSPDSPTTELIASSDFTKRMCVVTTFGRCLLFARRTKINPSSDIFYDLEYEINLCQLGVGIKEILPEKKEDSTSTFAIQTPYKSFIFQMSDSDSMVWIKCLLSAIKVNIDRNSAKEQPVNPIANKAAVLAKQEAEHELRKRESIPTHTTYRRSSFTSQRHKNQTNEKLATRPITTESRMLARSERLFRTNK